MNIVEYHLNKVYRYLLNRPNCRTTLEDVDSFVSFHIFHEVRSLNYILD